MTKNTTPDERKLGAMPQVDAPSNLEWLALQPLRVDLPKTARVLRETGVAFGAPTGKTQAQLDRDRALAIAFGEHSPCALNDLNAFQSMSRFARSVGFVALTRPPRMNLALAKPTRSE
jgi:hypothetical protein